jgi:hypothetical protein
MKLRILLLSILLFGCCGLWNMQAACEQSLNPQVKDRCFSVLALNQDDTGLCNKVENLTARDYCVMKIAIADANESKCATIENNSRRDICEKVSVGVGQKNSLACGYIKEDDETAELCRLRVS